MVSTGHGPGIRSSARAGHTPPGSLVGRTSLVIAVSGGSAAHPGVLSLADRRCGMSVPPPTRADAGSGPAADSRRRAGRRIRSTTRCSAAWPMRATAASIATWHWSAGSTSRPPRCSARASSASGPAASARRPPRSVARGRCDPRTTRFPPIATTGSPGAGASIRPCCWACSGACRSAAGIRRSTAARCTRSSSAARRCTPPVTRWASPRTGRSARTARR